MGEKDMKIVSLKMGDAAKRFAKKEVVRRKSDKGILAGTLHNVLRRGSRKKDEKYGHGVRWLNFCCNARKMRCFQR